MGSLIGTYFSWLGAIRLIYLLDIFCMVVLIYLFSNNLLKENFKSKLEKSLSSSNFDNFVSSLNEKNRWIYSIIPILIISLFSTSILSLLQSGLPLDLTKGGIIRPPLNETYSSLIIAFQLCLFLIFQWPLGVWLSNKNIKYGLRVSLISLSIGCFLLALSNQFTNGVIIVIFALILIAIGLTSFLPVATEAIIKISPPSKRGIGMALFSQCFGISSIIVPIASGKLIDDLGNGLFLWLIMSIFAMICIPLTNKIKTRNIFD